jgi:hypothetical protein
MLLTRNITSFRKVGRFYRRVEEVHHQRLYKPKRVAELLARIGFRVRRLQSYGRSPMLPRRAGFLAQKA